MNNEYRIIRYSTFDIRNSIFVRAWNPARLSCYEPFCVWAEEEKYEVFTNRWIHHPVCNTGR